MKRPEVVFTLIATHHTRRFPPPSFSVTAKKQSQTSPPAYSSSMPIALLPAGSPHLPLKEPCLFLPSPPSSLFYPFKCHPSFMVPFIIPTSKAVPRREGSIHKDDGTKGTHRVVQHGGPNPNSSIKSLQHHSRLALPSPFPKTIDMSHASTGLT